MGLHQKIVSKTLSFPCDCGETKDHADLEDTQEIPVVVVDDDEDDED